MFSRALFLFTNVFAILDVVNSRRNQSDRKSRSEAQSEQPPVSQVTSGEEAV